MHTHTSPSPADVLVEEEGEVVVEELQADLEVITLLAVGNGADEQVHEPPQRVLSET